MDLFKMFAISGAAMSAQRSRMSVISGNLANTETTRTPEGGPYRRRDVIFQATSLDDEFPDLLSETALDRSEGLLSVEVAGIKQSSRAPRKIFDPNHPDANPEGYVLLPDINVMEEMVDLLSAVRSYEANLTVYNATKGLVRRLLEIGNTP
ncbi:MAG TPA: flagellar basal body rod protein FlgC [Candidatus Acidoferrales bacterium]|nr:flagellar basal body rod protein FlgC [Candidatus Acidoferrales bacterium]